MEGMPDRVVAVNAGRRRLVRGKRKHLLDDLCVTGQTGALGDAPVAWFDLDRLVKSTGRECERMEKAVVGLGDPFADRVVREVTVVADRNVPVARRKPGIVVPVHHMTVDAGCRVMTQVTRTLPVAEGKESNSRKNAQKHGQPQREESRPAGKKGKPSVPLPLHGDRLRSEPLTRRFFRIRDRKSWRTVMSKAHGV